MAADAGAGDGLPRGPFPGEGLDLDALRVLKVRIPLRQHIQLHARRVLEGEGVSATVEAALRRYFDHLEAGRDAPAGPAGRVGPGTGRPGG